MIHDILKAVIKNKHAVVIAVAVLVVVAYAVPYGMDVSAQNTDNPGKHYGLTQGEGYGLSCDHFTGNNVPVRCR